MLPCFLKKNTPEDDDFEDPEYLDFDESALKEPLLKNLSNVVDTAPQTPTVLGQRFVFYMLATLTPLFALPVLLVFLFKSPPPLATVTLLGVSYHKLFFCLLIAAVVLIVSSILFFRTNLPLIATLFMSSLFCSMPLVVGLRYDLTLQHAIRNISYFANWPYFLQPFSLFVSLLLPVGILIYLTLQIQSIFSRERHSYVFLGAAAFLALSLYLGSYELSRAGIPNILAFIHSPDATSLQANIPIEQSAEQTFEPQTANLPEPPLQPPVSPNQDESFIPSEQISTIPKENGEPIQRVPSPKENGLSKTESTAPDFPAEAVRLEERFKGLLQEIDSKIIELSHLKSAIEAQQQADLTAINAGIGLLSKKTDMVLEHFNEKVATPQVRTNPPAVTQKEASETTKPFSSNPKNSTLGKLHEQLDFLTKKVEDIHTDQGGGMPPQAEETKK